MIYAVQLLQRSPLLCAPGLVKFVPAVARLFCLALPESFLTMFAQNKGDLCMYREFSVLLSKSQLILLLLNNLQNDIANNVARPILQNRTFHPRGRKGKVPFMEFISPLQIAAPFQPAACSLRRRRRIHREKLDNR